MKRIIVGGLVFCGMFVVLAGNTHRLLPADSDPCQQDMTHKSHVAELPMFHCIGHTEYEVNPGRDGLDAVLAWNHVHPWMDMDWHLTQGFSPEHAARLLDKAKE